MSNLLTPTSMESLKLPAELYWNGKVEPHSPLTNELFSVTNYDIVNWIEEDNIDANETIITNNDLKSKLDLDDSIELLNGDEMVVELCDIIENTENWDNTKPQTPSTTFVDDYMLDNSIQQQNVLTKVSYENLIDSTSCLTTAVGGNFNASDLYETTPNSNFDTAILTQLTPPHSPPLPQQFIPPTSKLNVDFPQQLTVPNFLNISEQLQIPETNASGLNWTPNENISNNEYIASPTSVAIDSSLKANDIQTQIVDEIVNSRAQELVDWHDEFESLSTSSASSLSFAEYLTDTHAITDEEILPNSSPDYIQDTSNDFSAVSTPISAATTTTVATPVAVITIDQLKKRTRPYGRALEDRKLRKKEQNKYAATRYRQKKKLEMEYILTEEQNLLARNEELQRQLAERKREVKYLKTLLREFYHKQQQLKQQQ